MKELRYEEHHKEPRTDRPPSLFAPMLFEGERIVSVETVIDDLGHAGARVWIERTTE